MAENNLTQWFTLIYSIKVNNFFILNPLIKTSNRMFWVENPVIEEENISAIISYSNEMMYKTSLKSFSSTEEIVHSFLNFFDMAGTPRDYKLVVKDQKLVLKTPKEKKTIKEEIEITEFSLMKNLVKSNPSKTVSFQLIPYDHMTSVYLQKTELKAPFLTKDSALTEEELRVYKKRYNDFHNKQVKPVPIVHWKPPVSKFKSIRPNQNVVKKPAGSKEKDILKDFDLNPQNLNMNTSSDLMGNNVPLDNYWN